MEHKKLLNQIPCSLCPFLFSVQYFFQFIIHPIRIFLDFICWVSLSSLFISIFPILTIFFLLIWFDIHPLHAIEFFFYVYACVCLRMHYKCWLALWLLSSSSFLLSWLFFAKLVGIIGVVTLNMPNAEEFFYFVLL